MIDKLRREHRQLLTGLAIACIPGAGIVFGVILAHKAIKKIKDKKNETKERENEIRR